MCTYRTQTFNFFKTGTIPFSVHSRIESLNKADQDDRKVDDLARLSFRKETLFLFCAQTGRGNFKFTCRDLAAWQGFDRKNVPAVYKCKYKHILLQPSQVQYMGAMGLGHKFFQH